MQPKILLSLALVLSGGLFGCSHIAGDVSVADTPKFSVLQFPEPPSQHQPWTPPPTDLPSNLVSSAKVLFDLGLADPRGCEYREFETASGTVRGQSVTVTAHGWILPERSGVKHRFAIGWDGVVYPVVRLGEKASVEQDMQALLRADELWRPTAPTNLFGSRWMFPSQKFFMSQTNMTAIKVALLLRLGEGKLAQEYWKAWRAVGNMGESNEDINDPFREFATECVYGRYDRAISAFMRADDALALADLLQLNRLWPELEKEARRRGFSQSLDEKGRTRPFFEFLKIAPELLADEERRAKEPPHQRVLHTGLDKFPDKSKRIAALISDLDEVSDEQDAFPRFGQSDETPLVAALIAEGDGAVDPLLECLEKDHRLTRSVEFGNDALPGGIVPVRDFAQAALDGIFTIHLDSTDAYRAYWRLYKALVPPADATAANGTRTVALIEPWTNVTVKLVVGGTSGSPNTKSRTETASAKQAVYKCLDPKLPGGPFHVEFWIMAMRETNSGKNCIIDAGHTFYVNLHGQLTGFSVNPMQIYWTSSYLELPDSDGNLDSAIAQFETHFDAHKLNKEMVKRSVNGISLRAVCPAYYFSDAHAPGGLALIPIVEAIDITDGVLRLDIRNPKTKVPASFWINLGEHKVIKSVVDNQEMDLTTGGRYAIPLKKP